MLGLDVRNGWKADIDTATSLVPLYGKERRMGWVVEAVVDWFWVGFVSKRSEGKPWWIMVLWTLAPVFVVGGLAALVWLITR
jgi:hypothetical protein